jgi:general secretion pathway protein A
MYKHFFGLRENPFNVNPDPRYLFLTPQTREALDDLTYGIQTRQGLILLTGEVGTGKTTVIYRLLDWLRQQQTPTAFIFNSHLEISHLFDFILADFGVPFDSGLKRGALMRLNLWLLDRYRAGETPVVIVDEAQGLPSHVLEEIRMLLNLETPREKLLQIVLAGQPELEERLKRPELRQIKQRIALRCKTAALTLEETHNYIQARLHVAGSNGKPVFTSEAINAVHFYSRGIPRVINLLCEHSLINAYVDGVQPVPAHIIMEVAREFQFDDMKRSAPSQDSVDALFSALIAAEGSMAGPSDQNIVPTQDHKIASRLQEAKATFNAALGVPAPRLGAPYQRRIEATRPPGLTTSVSNGSAELLAELAMEQTPLAFSPRLHVVEQKGKRDLSPGCASCWVPPSQKLIHPPSPVKVKKSASITSGRTTLLALHFMLAQWSAKWRDLTSAAQTHRRTILHQQLERSLHGVRRWYQRYVVSMNRCLTVFGPIDWPRSKGSVYRWLQQPSNPTGWRLTDSFRFEMRARIRQRRR